MILKKYVEIEYLQIFTDVSKYPEKLLVPLQNFVKIKDDDHRNVKEKLL